MRGLSCNSCNREFGDDADQKHHYRSEWHRYNLKRKVAGVPGVTESLFQARQPALAEEHKTSETPMFYCCALCGKEYRSSKAHSQHLNSRIHIMKASQESGQTASITIIKPISDRLPSNSASISKSSTLREGYNEENDESGEFEWKEVDPNDDMEEASASLTNCRGETSGVKSPGYVEMCNATSPGPMVGSTDASSDQASVTGAHNPNEVPEDVPKGFMYESQIGNWHVKPHNPRDAQLLHHCAEYVQDLIARIHPDTPGLLADFIERANSVLKFVAHVGMPEEKMKFLENMCRAVECILWKIEALSIIKTRTPMGAYQVKVKRCKEASNHARTEFLQSDGIVKQQFERSSWLTKELNDLSARARQIFQELEIGSSATTKDIESFSAQVHNLCQELVEITLSKSNFQRELNSLTKAGRREQKRHQYRERTLLEAETALAKAIEGFHFAQKDYDFLMILMSQLQNLYDHFFD